MPTFNPTEKYQMWQGDCLELMQNIPDGSVDLVVTDPPYNISQTNKSFSNGFEIKQDFGDWDYKFDPAPVCQELKRVLKPNGQMYIFTSSQLLPDWIINLRDTFEYKLLTWIKPNPRPSVRKSIFVSATEPVLYFWVKGEKRTFNWLGHQTMYDWTSHSLSWPGTRYHPTEKPIKILTKYLMVSSNPGDVVLDPFMGSGSTGIACHNTNRRFIGIEKDETYYKIACDRLAKAQQQMRFEEMIGA